ncbi:MAG: hypothetical protein HQL38_19060 [Alphaproteobacteria bacterium]|nr:hypothetical protein [Alphaproteobacteria bacterium]
MLVAITLTMMTFTPWWRRWRRPTRTPYNHCQSPSAGLADRLNQVKSVPGTTLHSAQFDAGAPDLRVVADPILSQVVLSNLIDGAGLGLFADGLDYVAPPPGNWP